jgi:hypothetical protein
VALGRQIVDLVGPHILHQPDQVGAVRHVAIAQMEAHPVIMRVLVEIVDPRGVERRGPPLHPVDLIALRQKKLGEIGAILPRDARDERPFPPIQFRHPDTRNRPKPPHPGPCRNGSSASRGASYKAKPKSSKKAQAPEPGKPRKMRLQACLARDLPASGVRDDE